MAAYPRTSQSQYLDLDPETSSEEGEPFDPLEDPWTAPLFTSVNHAVNANASLRKQNLTPAGMEPSSSIGATQQLSFAKPLAVRVVTWNLNEALPTDVDIRRVVGEGLGVHSDVVVVASQEGVAAATWSKALTAAIETAGMQLVKVAICAMGKINLAVFATNEAIGQFVEVKTSTVATGVGNVMANKGGVGIMLTHVGGARLLFVGAHLAAHQDEVKARNDSAKRILAKLRFDGLGSADADAVVFAGDLNYRVEANRRVVDMLLGDYDKQLALEIMRRNDQLARAKEESRSMALAPFGEGFLGFPPTYKFDRKTDRYDTSSKARVPSWTDRILFAPDGGGVWKLNSYTSIDACKHSDHRPVTAAFTLALPMKAAAAAA
ncbi:inositol polyphosphate 5-phosphatase [Pseudoscourfieldia marina]